MKNLRFFGKTIIQFFLLCFIFISYSYGQIMIELGKNLFNIDDIRLGDYSIYKGSLPSKALDEVVSLLEVILNYNKIEIKKEEESLEEYFTKLRDEVFKLYKYESDLTDNILWGREEELWIEKLIVSNFDDLILITRDEEKKALLTYVKAQYLLLDKKLNDGLGLLKEVSKKFINSEYSGRAKLEYSFQMFKQMRYDTVIVLSKKLIEEYPDSRISQDAYYLLGRCFYIMGKYEDAIHNFNILINNYPKNKWNEGAKYFRAKCYYYLNNYEQAIRSFEDFINTYPKSIYNDDALEMLSYSYVSAQDYKRAIESMSRYKEKFIDDVFKQIAADGMIVHFAVLGKSKRNIELEERNYYEFFINSFPDKIRLYIENNSSDNGIIAQALFALVQYHLNYGNLDSAIFYLNILNLPQYSIEYDSLIRSTNLKNGECINCGSKLILKNNIYHELGRAYIKKGNLKEAEVYINKLKNSIFLRDYYSLLFQKAEHFLKINDYNNAENLFWEIYKSKEASSTNRAMSLMHIAYIYVQLGKSAPQDPEYILKKIVEEFPNEPISNFVKSNLEKGDKNEKK